VWHSVNKERGRAKTQPAATSVETVNRKHPIASVGKLGRKPSETPAGRETPAASM